jgi:hypothetical protein
MSEGPAEPQPEQRLEIQIPPEVEPGVHADFASIWHTPATFVLDFASLREPPSLVEEEDTGQRFINVSARVVTRVRIPGGQIWELMRALEQQLTAWERETGQRPPDDTGGLPNLG